MAEAKYDPQAGPVKVTMIIAGVVLILLMTFGLIMRLNQAGLIEIESALFYQIMTAHGAGMVGTAGLTGAAVLWYFMSRYVPLVGAVYNVFLGLFLLGVVFIHGAIFIGGYSGAGTVMVPLPAMSGGLWSSGAAATFLLGYVSIGVGFLVMHLEVGRQLIRAYGGIGGAMAWPMAFGSSRVEDAPPASVVAAMASTIFNVIGVVLGAAVLVASLVNLLVPSFEVDALLAKNMIYVFGHIFINASIYMAVIAVYEVIPEYTGKPWKTSRAFAISWSFILLFVIAVYPHHLLQDVAMPAWALVTGQIISYLSGIPLLAVTAFSLLVYLSAGPIKWDLASSLLVLGVAGWSVGSVPAIIDGMIVVNKVMHNTQWVPGHFHIYLILGEIAMAFGFMAWLVRDARKSATTGTRMGGLDRLAIGTYLVGGAGFTVMFLISGAMSIPRRWAVHAPEWTSQAGIASIFAVLVILGSTLFVVSYLRGLAGDKDA